MKQVTINVVQLEDVVKSAARGLAVAKIQAEHAMNRAAKVKKATKNTVASFLIGLANGLTS